MPKRLGSTAIRPAWFSRYPSRVPSSVLWPHAGCGCARPFPFPSHVTNELHVQEGGATLGEPVRSRRDAHSGGPTRAARSHIPCPTLRRACAVGPSPTCSAGTVPPIERHTPCRPAFEVLFGTFANRVAVRDPASFPGYKHGSSPECSKTTLRMPGEDQPVSCFLLSVSEDTPSHRTWSPALGLLFFFPVCPPGNQSCHSSKIPYGMVAPFTVLSYLSWYDN